MVFMNSLGNTIDDQHSVQGLPWLTWLGLQRRLNTQIGADPFRPELGMNLAPFIDSEIDLTRLTILLENSLADLYGFKSVSVQLLDPDNVIVRIFIEGYDYEYRSPWAIQFERAFG